MNVSLIEIPQDLPGFNQFISTLLEKNPDLKLFYKMPPAMQNRESFFLANSIKGYVEFLREGRF